MSMYIHIYIDTLSGLEFCERRNAVNSINDSIAKPGALQGALQRPSANHSNCPNLSSLTGPSFMDTFEIRLHISHQIVRVNVPWEHLSTFRNWNSAPYCACLGTQVLPVHNPTYLTRLLAYLRMSRATEAHTHTLCISHRHKTCSCLGRSNSLLLTDLSMSI